MWGGMNLAAWMRLLARNRFDIGWNRIPVALGITAWASINSLLHGIEHVIFSRRLAQVKLVQDPVFIIGHWRSGTTLLHELLACDERFTYPTTYECYSPNHFLLTEGFASKRLRFLLPAKRLQDDMPLEWTRPQEDEFALCNLGQRSPFLTVAFPNRPPQDQEYLELEGLAREEIEQWQRAFQHFLVQITYCRPRRILLKSPQHSCRIPALREQFPDARFAYIVRDPLDVIPSTMRLWKLLYASQGLQVPTYDMLEEHVFHVFQQMFHRVERTQTLVPRSRFCVLRYEDLVLEPPAQVLRIYEQIELGDFEPARPALEAYLDSIAGYQPSRYPRDEALRERITQRTVEFRRRFGYA
jgi:hypothetical protein